MVFNRAIIVLLLFYFSLSESFTSESLKVKLDHGGVLVGRHYVTINGRHMRAFMGIPYAKPPVGDLRFRSPVAFPEWKGERLAIKDSPECLHICPFIRATELEGQEDCLYLNVYTPPLEFIEKNKPLPVMVYIHGGGWESGTGGDHYYGPQHILDRNVILVSGNYRLGPLGFLSTETTECPGNFGLKDQVEVLKWVQKNIASFGGNPKSVTIFGESAGSASITYHMNSEKSKGLFHRAIPQSGFFFNPWAQPAHKGEPAKKAVKLGKLLNCENKNTKAMIDCLRKVPAQKLMSKFNDFFQWENQPMIPFPPVVEPEHAEAFLYEHPRETTLKSLNIPIMTGITTGEGLLTSAPIITCEKMLASFKKDKNKLLAMVLNYDHWDIVKQNEITQKLEEFYLKDGHNYDKLHHQNFTDVSFFF
ncbi:CES5A.2 family protein [Megaselia abdita]